MKSGFVSTIQLLSCWLVAVAITVAFSPVNSRAATIFSQTGTPEGAYTETSLEYWAQGFTISGTSMTLTSVDVLLQAAGPLSQYFVALYSNNSGSPGSLLETLSGTNNPQTSGTYTYTSTGSLLSANTSYWILQGITSGGGFQYWNEENNTSPEVGSSIGAEFSQNSGTTWSLQASHSMQMVVNGTPVPEPSTALLLIMGGVAMFVRLRFPTDSITRLAVRHPKRQLNRSVEAE